MRNYILYSQDLEYVSRREKLYDIKRASKEFKKITDLSTKLNKKIKSEIKE